MTQADLYSRRLSWRGILAGLVVGLVVQLTLLFLGIVITGLTGITLTGVGIQAAIWLALSVLAGAYFAGLTAVRASAPATVNNEHGIAAMTQKDAGLTGLVTGSLLVLASTVFTYNTATSVIGTAGNVLGGAASAAGVVGGAAGAAGANGDLFQTVLGNVSQEEVAAIVAENSPELSERQTNAAANVVTGIIRRAGNDLGQQNISNLGDFATARVRAVQNALIGPEFVTRLQRQGLSQAEAQQTQRVVQERVNDAERQYNEVLATTERIARRTARDVGLGWLLAAGLMLGAATLGARSAATGSPLERRDGTPPRRV